MDPYEEARMAQILQASDANEGLVNIPRPGRNPEFDAYVQETFGDVDPEHADIRELRRAAWRTWRTAAPTNAGSASRHLVANDEDEELQRVLALSAQEHRAAQGSDRNTPIVLDDDDDEMQRVIAMSTTTTGPPASRDNDIDEEERMMKEAIAASLAVSENPSQVATEEDPEDDMEAAIKASLASFEADQRGQKRQKTEEAPLSRTISPEPPARASKKSSSPDIEEITTAAASKRSETEPAQPVGLRLGGGLQIDRAQMERERIARQAARAGKSAETKPAETKAVEPKPAGSKTVDRQNATASSSKTASSFKRTPSSSNPSPSNGRSLPQPLPRLKDHPLQSVGPFPRDAAGEYYLDGELRHIQLGIGRPSTANTFNAKELFGKHSEMSLLILSSFVWDNPWIDRDFILPTPDLVPTIRVCRAESREKQGKLQTMPDGEVWSYPYMDGRQGAEHMKFAWIFYKTGRLRVAIFTANMVDYDWDRIENTVFIQDFLPTKASSPPSPESLPDFPDQFRTLFNHLKLSKAVSFLIKAHPCGKDIPLEADTNWAALSRYDWSRVQVRLVISVSGKYAGFDQIVRSGIGRLGSVIREEGWMPQSGEKLAVEYQGSSLGNYSSKWMNDFYHCCEGKDLMTMSRWKDDKKMPPIKVIFPSLATVDKSVNGRPGGGTMFCGSAFKPETAPLFHDANSKRGGVLMHTKMIIAIFEPKPNQLGLSSSSSGKRKADEMTESKDDVGGWIYVGSHNFSPSAWGTLNFTNKPPTLNVTNYELGIVFPLSRANAHAMANTVAAHQRPPRQYSKSDVPWSQKDHLK